MAFEGNNEALALHSVLTLIRSKKHTGMITFHTDKGSYHLAIHDGKVSGIASSNPSVSLIRILNVRGIISSEQMQKIQTELLPFSDEISAVRSMSSVNEEQIQLAIYHQAEGLFFDFLECQDGRYELFPDLRQNFLMFDIAFRDWIDEMIPDVSGMKVIHKDIPDFDGKIIWVSPEEIRNLPEQLSLDELKVLAGYRPGITFRAFWYILTEPRNRILNALKRLQDVGIFTVTPPVKPKLPDSRPFLRALLATAIARLEDAFQALGTQGELVSVLRSIAEHLEKAPSTIPSPPVASASESLDDLSSITSSIEDILSIDNLDDLEISAKPATPSEPEPASTSQRPSGPPVHSKPVAKPAESADDSMQMDSSDGDAITLEDIVAAKVRYKKFISNVTMGYNRLRMKNITYFDMLNVPPNADRKAIHTAFVKLIRRINPSGVDLKERDKEYLDKAVWIRDRLKEAYQTLMDPKTRKQYVLSMKEVREIDERKKSEAMILFNRGMLEFKNNNFVKARELFQQAIEFDPKSPVYYEMIADIDKEELAISANKFFQAGTLAFTQKNDYDRAIKLIKKAISMLPRQIPFHLKLAEIQATRSELRKDAIQNYEIVIDMDPSNSELHLALANFYKNSDMKQEASNKFQDVLKWNPDNLTAKKELLALRKEGILPQKRTDQEKDKQQEQADEDLL